MVWRGPLHGNVHRLRSWTERRKFRKSIQQEKERERIPSHFMCYTHVSTVSIWAKAQVGLNRLSEALKGSRAITAIWTVSGTWAELFCLPTSLRLVWFRKTASYKCSTGWVRFLKMKTFFSQKQFSFPRNPQGGTGNNGKPVFTLPVPLPHLAFFFHREHVLMLHNFKSIFA